MAYFTQRPKEIRGGHLARRRCHGDVSAYKRMQICHLQWSRGTGKDKELGGSTQTKKRMLICKIKAVRKQRLCADEEIKHAVIWRCWALRFACGLWHMLYSWGVVCDQRTRNRPGLCVLTAKLFCLLFWAYLAAEGFTDALSCSSDTSYLFTVLHQLRLVSWLMCSGAAVRSQMLKRADHTVNRDVYSKPRPYGWVTATTNSFTAQIN